MSRRDLPHLRLVPWHEGFRTPFARLAADPRITTYIGRGSPWSQEWAEKRHEECLDHWRRHGFGWRGVVEGDSEVFLGIAAANYLAAPVLEADTSSVEIGWWTDPEHWGRGIASRCAKQIRDEVFSSLETDVIVARLHRDNIASATVAQNTGLTYRGDFTTDIGVPAHLYSLNRADWTPEAERAPLG